MAHAQPKLVTQLQMPAPHILQTRLTGPRTRDTEGMERGGGRGEGMCWEGRGPGGEGRGEVERGDE